MLKRTLAEMKVDAVRVISAGEGGGEGRAELVLTLGGGIGSSGVR